MNDLFRDFLVWLMYFSGCSALIFAAACMRSVRRSLNERAKRRGRPIEIAVLRKSSSKVGRNKSPENSRQ